MKNIMTCSARRRLVTPYLEMENLEKVMLVACRNWDGGSPLSGRGSHCKINLSGSE